MSRPRATPGGALFWSGVVAGWGLITAGVAGGLANVTSVPHWLAWLAGALLVHDLVVAPFAAGLGGILRVAVPGWFRAYVQGALVFTAIVLAVALPVALRLGGDPRNSSELPVDAWGGVVVVVLESLLVWGLIRSLRALRRTLRSP